MRIETKKIPQSAGIYFFKDKQEKILYIGKAANLRNRIRSYYNSRPKDPCPHTKRASATKSLDSNNAHHGVGARISKMLEVAKCIDWQETESEIEALILESRLIKKYHPLFNIMLRDDKQYFFVAFTKEKFPKILITHQPAKQQRIKLSQTIGPFADGTALKQTLKLLRRIFPYCTCKQKHNNYCLNYHLSNCPGFCCLNPVRGRPAKGVATATSGRPASNGVKKEAMAKQAAAYKKNITAIKEILSGKKKTLIKKFEKKLNVLAQKEDFEKAIELRDKIEKLKKVFENARTIQNLSPIDISIYQYSRYRKAGVLEKLKKSFKLPNAPQRIEGYDVSNIGGELATGAMVVFTPSTGSGQANYQPDKNEYRKFKIRAAGGDTEMLREILARRFKHPEWQYPDLILIDGGKGQLNAAIAAMPNKTLVIALTKNTEHKGSHIYTSNKKTAMPLKSLPPAVKNLILQIDAEAHRFAIRYYQKLHRKKFNK